VTPKKWLIGWDEVSPIEQPIKELLTVDGDLIYTPQGVTKSPLKVQLYQTHGFKAGFSRYLNERLTTHELDVQIPDIDVSKKEELFDKFSLRDYQREAVEAILQNKFGIIQLPTATGKSRIAITLAMLLPRPALIIVPSIDLLTQFSQIFKEYKIKYGVVGGNLKIWDDNIMLTTTKSVIGTSKILKEYTLKLCKTILVDEVHHSTGKLYGYLGKAIAPYRIGFSATPYDKTWSDAKKLKLFANFGSIVYSGKGDERVESNRIQPKVYVYKYKAKSLSTDFFSAVAAHDFISQRRYGIVRNDDRNALILKIADHFRRSGLKVFIIVSWTSHVDELRGLAARLNIPVYFLTGNDDGTIRADVYNKMRSNENITICGTVGGEGVDITSLNVVILGDVGKSEIKVIQGIGRNTRKGENKTTAIAIDIQDAIFPKHVKKRNKIYKEENYEIYSLVEYFKNLKNNKENTDVQKERNDKVE
jgi:superfamily II DNA or RNA helicase